jgi:bifunctional enzyme CysN/CysC/sulfate adenylyltransferase subunit 1
MATGASTADAAVILVDARLGVLPQTRRHAAIASLLGIPRLAVAINKMDLVGFDEAAFRRIEQEVRAFAQPLGFAQLSFFPVSARLGDNITTSSARAPWHTGGTVLQFLDTVPVDRERAGHPFRFPVQTVIRTKEQDSRGLAGQIAAGSVAVGDEVVVLPSGARSRVKAIETFEGPLARAQAPQSVLLRLAHEVDASRGDLLAPPEDAPVPRLRFEATAIWLSEQPLDLGRAYLVKHTTRSTPARIEAVLSLLDPETLKEAPATTLALNDIGRISIRCGRPMVVEPYAKSRATGALILIDAISNETVAAATVCAENAGAGPGGDPAGKREQGQRRTAVAAPILVVVGEEEEATLAAAHKLEKKLSERGHLVTVARRVGPALACSDAGVIVLLPMVGEDRARVLLNTALSAGARAARIDAAEQGGFEVGFEEALAALGR